jgi:4-hydroxybenzoate polyprenyltransferase
MSRARAYAQLVRLPNVFTAPADVLLGLFAVSGRVEDGLPSPLWPRATALVAASVCLYAGGMVFNDVFDVAQDIRERPHRPLPSGRIGRSQAVCLGGVLLLAGWLLALAAGWREGGLASAPSAVAAVLVGVILFYDGWLKKTWAGPLGMGACRFLNVLLGLSPGWHGLDWWALHMAAVVGVYIVGVTWFARTEAGMSRRSALRSAAAVMIGALVLALALPAWFPLGTTSPLYVFLLAGLWFILAGPVRAAIEARTPLAVQGAVKRAILGLVFLDATLATALAGPAGLTILLLLVPAMYLGRWIYST